MTGNRGPMTVLHDDPPVRIHQTGAVRVLTLDRVAVRNAVDRPTADALTAAVRAADADDTVRVIVLTGAGDTFCAGADLKALAGARGNRLDPDGDAPMGPSRLVPTKPVIAAIEGHAVAGGLELALWADLRVAADTAVLGVFCRRVGVPLIDGGTVRLPRLVGLGRALDLILTGRPVDADEALRIGLVDRVVPAGTALDAAIALGAQIAAFPWTTVLADLHSARAAFDRPLPDALAAEFASGMAALTDGTATAGAARFAAGAGRHGAPIDDPSRREG